MRALLFAAVAVASYSFISPSPSTPTAPAPSAWASQDAASLEQVQVVWHGVRARPVVNPSGTDLGWDSLSGRVLLVGYLSTNCCSFNAFADDLAALQEEYADRGLVVLGLSTDDVSDEGVLLIEWPAATAEMPGGAPALPERGGEFLSGTGRWFIIDVNGRLVGQELGAGELEATVQSFFAGDFALIKC